MLKISDILKKTRQPEVTAPAAPPSVKPTVTPNVMPVVPSSAVKPPSPALVTVAAAVAPEIEVGKRTAAAQVYQQAIAAVGPLMGPYASESHLQKTRDVIALVIQQYAAKNDCLLEFFFEDYPADVHFLPRHAVNVCVLALALARDFPFDAGQLKKLGLGAVLHDIGLAQCEDIIAQPVQLKEHDLAEIRKHPLLGKDLAAKLTADLDYEVFDVIQQEHERVDGSGYPFGLKDNQISEFSKLVAVADVYEALTHARPYRLRHDGLTAVRQLLVQKQSFSRAYLKSLINILGVFPVGSLVELNTRETGVVLRQTKNMPLRPVISITHTAQQQKLAENKRIDLAKNFSVYIKGCVS